MPNNEFGDFQTPVALARRCLHVLGLGGGARVLEPTCGLGNFLEAAAALDPASERVGIELQNEYVARASKWGEVRVGNIFLTDLPSEVTWSGDGPLYVVGNPPWVTSAELNRMDSSNLPKKENFKKARGLEALLGSSNFDVAEFIILKVLSEYQTQPLKLGMLCKTQVARNVIEYAASARLPIFSSSIHRIDAVKWFGAGVDACWFTVQMDASVPPSYTCTIHSDLFEDDDDGQSQFGVIDGRLVSDVVRYESVRSADGRSPYEWRSGLKHDAASVFELAASPAPTSSDGKMLDLEPEFVFPLLKSTDVFRGRHRELSRWVIVPQQAFGVETNSLAWRAPMLWKYLNSHGDILDGRKSSVYRNRPRFSVFGHGEYTYAPYKAAVSGLHKEPIFRLVAPINGKPVVLDDTCYFLPFTNATEARLVVSILNSEPCVNLIESMAFWDSKRPITKRLLARIDLNRLPVDPGHILEDAARAAASDGLPFDVSLASQLLGHLGSGAVQESELTLF